MEEMKTTVADEKELQEEAAAEVKPEKAEKKKSKKAEAELSALRKELEAQTEKCKEYEDRYLRMMAEYDNFRKRSAKEKEGVYAEAYSDCIANLLPILDNLERAGKSDHLDGVKKGLEMTSKAFSEALSKMGVTEIETATFDPNLHNAVMHIEDESFGESEIVEVFQKGYAKGDKVIRYAMVKVAN
ncbi:MAG: nucleotide exchange factor GrpE [Ruminococcaceae bacterium]|nr:nucleotide exchange factor GrpE [Oscillospiraceae bacterium]